MIIKPKIRGFICTTAHPAGCEANILEQINYTKEHPAIENGPKRVLVIGSSSGYGMPSRIAATFGAGADTLGVFFEKPGSDTKPGTAGFYNAVAFDKLATEAGYYAKSINGDAFSNEVKQQAIDTIKADLGQVDLVVYSIASPVRKLPDTGELVRSTLKPIGKPYSATAVDTNKDEIISVDVEPAVEQEIQDTITVMGGQDWELWIKALHEAGVLADGCKSIAYSYIGTEITWPIYWHGTIGKAKEDLDRAAAAIDALLKGTGGEAHVAVLKSVVTQASSAIPVMPLYIAIVYKVMKEKGLHEGTMEHVFRLFSQQLYKADGSACDTDDMDRIRMDDWELQEDVQNACKALWSQVTTQNLRELTDYDGYKEEFLKLFGFGLDEVDYEADVNPNPSQHFLNV